MVDSNIAAATLHIDLDALVENWRLIGQRAAPAVASAVVKADAYGLGAVPVARALADAGCRHFFVAHLCETLPLEQVLPPDARLYVLNGLMPGAEAVCAATRAIPVLNSTDQIERWAAQARVSGRRLPALLQVDTGMSRMGLSPRELDRLVAAPRRLDGVELLYVISHLACADDPESPANTAQAMRFEQVSRHFPDLPRALDNSAGALGPRPGHFDLVRPGIALYGGAPHNDAPNPMRRVVGLEARIVQLRTIPAGTGVGYGLTFTAQRESVIATIGVGYADGWPWQLGNRGAAFIGGRRVPIVGRVSMDSITIDVTDIPEQQLYPGAPVELLGSHQSVDDVARDAGTISYEILTRLGDRYARVYHGASAACPNGSDATCV